MNPDGIGECGSTTFATMCFMQHTTGTHAQTACLRDVIRVLQHTSDEHRTESAAGAGRVGPWTFVKHCAARSLCPDGLHCSRSVVARVRLAAAHSARRRHAKSPLGDLGCSQENSPVPRRIAGPGALRSCRHALETRTRFVRGHTTSLCARDVRRLGCGRRRNCYVVRRGCPCRRPSCAQLLSRIPGQQLPSARAIVALARGTRARGSCGITHMRRAPREPAPHARCCVRHGAPRHTPAPARPHLLLRPSF